MKGEPFNDPIYKGYKAVMISKQMEETLVSKHSLSFSLVNIKKITQSNWIETIVVDHFLNRSWDSLAINMMFFCFMVFVYLL